MSFSSLKRNRIAFKYLWKEFRFFLCFIFYFLKKEKTKHKLILTNFHYDRARFYRIFLISMVIARLFTRPKKKKKRTWRTQMTCTKPRLFVSLPPRRFLGSVIDVVGVSFHLIPFASTIVVRSSSFQCCFFLLLFLLFGCICFVILRFYTKDYSVSSFYCHNPHRF